MEQTRFLQEAIPQEQTSLASFQRQVEEGRGVVRRCIAELEDFSEMATRGNRMEPLAKLCTVLQELLRTESSIPTVHSYLSFLDLKEAKEASKFLVDAAMAVREEDSRISERPASKESLDALISSYHRLESFRQGIESRDLSFARNTLTALVAHCTIIFIEKESVEGETKHARSVCLVGKV